MNDLMATLMDLANILGGFLLAIGLLRGIPRVGADLDRAAGAVGAFSGVVGVIALVTGGYFLLNHAVNGPHVFHFELVAIAVGVLLLWSRLPWVGGKGLARGDHAAETPAESGTRTALRASSAQSVTGVELLLCVFGIIAICVGIQGLFTPN